MEEQQRKNSSISGNTRDLCSILQFDRWKIQSNRLIKKIPKNCTDACEISGSDRKSEIVDIISKSNVSHICYIKMYRRIYVAFFVGILLFLSQKSQFFFLVISNTLCHKAALFWHCWIIIFSFVSFVPFRIFNA